MVSNAMAKPRFLNAVEIFLAAATSPRGIALGKGLKYVSIGTKLFLGYPKTQVLPLCQHLRRESKH